MKNWKLVSRKFLWGHRPEISPRGSWGVTRIYEGETLKISKWVSHHVFFWSRSFCHYLYFSNQMSRNQVIVIWIFWSTTKLGFWCHNWLIWKYHNGFFLMCSPWLIESKKSNKFKFRWVELILSTFKDPTFVSDQGRWRVTRR